MAISEMVCPACAAPLNVNPASEYQRCLYCHSTLRIAQNTPRLPDSRTPESRTPESRTLEAFTPMPDLRPTWQRLATLFLSPLGRMSRAHFVVGAGVLVVILALLSPFLPEEGSDGASGFSGFLVMCVLYSYAAMTVKRYHDIGKSGWWYFIIMIPFGIFYQWYELFSRSGEPRPNQFGEVPSQKASDLLASNTKVAMGLRN